MTHRWKAAFTTLILGCLLAGAGRPAVAHPHVWIDLRTTVMLDDAGRVAAIGQEWLFDPMYSAYATAGVDTESDQGREFLSELVDDSMKNLRDYDYFMRVRADGARQAFDAPTDFTATLREGRLLYRFTVPLARPVDPRALDLDIAVFDPTYYIDMVHLEGDVVAFQGSNPGNCGARIVAPTPDMNAIMAAQSADQNTRPDDTIGAQFAETVIVTCR